MTGERQGVGVVAALVMLLAAGCSDAAGPRETNSSDEASAGESALDSTRPAARHELRRAVGRLLSRPALGFHLEIEFPDGLVHHRLEGGADTAEKTWWVVAETASAGEDPLAWSARSDGGRTWMQMDAWTPPRTGCWLEVAPGTVPLGFLGLTPGIPGYVRLLGHLRADEDTSADPDSLAAHTDAGTVQILFPGQTSDAMGFTNLTRANVRDTDVALSIVLDDGQITSITTTGKSLLDAWPAARDRLDDEVEPFVEGMSSTLTFLDAAPPSPSPLLPPDELTFAASDKGCGPAR